MHTGRIPRVACVYGHKITANNEESDNKRKERIGEGGTGWGQGRDKRERRGEERGRRELKGRYGMRWGDGDGEGGRREEWVGRKRKGERCGKGRGRGERKKRGIGKR